MSATRSRPLSHDTTAQAEAVQFDLLRKLTPAVKARKVDELTVAANCYALAGLRERHPGAPERELWLRLAALRLGDDLVSKAYGWPAGRDGVSGTS